MIWIRLYRSNVFNLFNSSGVELSVRMKQLTITLGFGPNPEMAGLVE